MAKDKAKPIRCLLDVTGIPPSRFALPDDGRQSKHLCQQRWRLTVILARRAQHDGSSTFQSVKTLVELTEIPKRTLHRLLDDLERLGVLQNGSYHPKLHTRIRSLHLEKLSPEIIGFEEDDDATVPSSGSQNEVTVPSSDSTVPSSQSTVPSSGLTVPSSQTSVPNSADFGTHNALESPPQSPPPSSFQPEATSERKEAEEVFEEEQEQPELTDDEYADMEKSRREYLWTYLLKQVPEEMQGAVANKEQREKVIEQMDGRNALQPAYLLAALKDWVKMRDMPIEERKYGKWGCWLEECAPFVARQLKAQRAEEAARSREAIRSNLAKLYPDSKIVVPESLGQISTSFGWIVVRHSCVGADGKALSHVQVYPDEKTAREKSAIPCAKSACDSASHIVRSYRSACAELIERENPDE